LYLLIQADPNAFHHSKPLPIPSPPLGQEAQPLNAFP
jgi:hypothetical protein